MSAVSDLARRPVAELARMQAAAEEVRECQRVLAKAELNIVGECLKGQGTFYEYDHYPNGDVYDADTHGQYYYHAHRGARGEHGHFHTFLRAAGIPKGLAPVPYQGEEAWPEGDDVLSHLIAISMDRHGHAIGLFTTNRWVTGENWFAARDVIAMLDRFEIDHAYPSWPVNRWITGMLRLFRPEIEALLRERDATWQAWQAKHPHRDAFEDRELEIISQIPIDVDAQVAALRAASR